MTCRSPEKVRSPHPFHRRLRDARRAVGHLSDAELVRAAGLARDPRQADLGHLSDAELVRAAGLARDPRQADLWLDLPSQQGFRDACQLLSRLSALGGRSLPPVSADCSSSRRSSS